MQYTAIINGRSYDLPRRTLRIAEEMENLIKNDGMKGISLRNKFQAVLDFIRKILGEENTKEILGTDNLDEMDMSELTIAFRTIFDAYKKPVSDYNAEQARMSFDSLPVDKISKLSEASAKIAGMAAEAEAKKNL